MTGRIPAEVFPPCEFLADDLKERGETGDELAKRMAWPRCAMRDFLDGRRHMTIAMAVDLSDALGNSAQFWLNLQAAWDGGQARKLQAERATQRGDAS